MKLRQRGLVPLLMVALALAAVGCAPRGVQDVTPMKEPSPTPTEAPATPTPLPAAPKDEPDVPADAADAVAWARRDAAERLGVSEEEVILVSVEFVEWRDSSLGCPQPERMYLQVITPGYRIHLRGNDTVLDYRAARGAEQAILCPRAGGLGERQTQ